MLNKKCFIILKITSSIRPPLLYDPLFTDIGGSYTRGFTVYVHQFPSKALKSRQSKGVIRIVLQLYIHIEHNSTGLATMTFLLFMQSGNTKTLNKLDKATTQLLLYSHKLTYDTSLTYVQITLELIP